MNTFMVNKLIQKDWQLYRLFILIYTLLGITASGLLLIPATFAFHAGIVILVTVLIGASAHICISSVVVEKKEFQLSFLMGLPIKPLDYALSKLLGGLFIYGVCWLSVIVFTAAIILVTDLPNGMLPLLLLCAVELFLATAILLGIGVVTGSEPATIICLVLLNLLFNLFMFSVAGLSEINQYLWTATAVFNSTFWWIIVAEISLLVIVLALSIYIKSRQRCFL